MEKRTRTQSDLVRVLEEQLAIAHKRAEDAERQRVVEVADANARAEKTLTAALAAAEERHKTALTEAVKEERARADKAIAEANARAEAANARVERIGTVGMQCFSSMITKNTLRIESVKDTIVAHRSHIERGQQLTYVNSTQAVGPDSPTISFRLIKGTRKEIDDKISSSQTSPKPLNKVGDLIQTDRAIKPTFDKQINDWLKSKRHAEGDGKVHSGLQMRKKIKH